MPAVVFIHRGGPESASYRYRTQVPAEHIGARINEGEADIVVFSKPIMEDVEIAKKARADGAKVVVDICDPLFNQRPWYEDICRIAHKCVAPTEYAAAIVGRRSLASVAIIPDPYEFEEREPHAEGDSLVWFGHNANLKDIQPHAHYDNLRVVTGPGVDEGMTHYTPENLHRALREANICLLPHRRGTEYKSPNRFINAVRMGVFPVCEPMPAYSEFKRSAWIGNIKTGLRFAKDQRAILNSLVKEMQDQIRGKYSPDTVGEQWKQLLESI